MNEIERQKFRLSFCIPKICQIFTYVHYTTACDTQQKPHPYYLSPGQGGDTSGPYTTLKRGEPKNYNLLDKVIAISYIWI